MLRKILLDLEPAELPHEDLTAIDQGLAEHDVVEVPARELGAIVRRERTLRRCVPQGTSTWFSTSAGVPAG